MKVIHIMPLLVAAVCLALPADAAGKLGEDAPALAIADWVKGDPITIEQAAEKDKVVVVEFWATWCPPCRASIPHLTELQKKYKDDAIIIGVSAEDAATIRPFVEDMGDNMAYRVAADRGRRTSKAYMEAFGQSGIPHAFIIDRDGKLVFHSHPMDRTFDETLAAVIEGDFDLEAVKQELARAERLEEVLGNYSAAIMSDAGDEEAEARAREISDELYELLKDDANRMSWLAYALAETEDIVLRDLDFAEKLAVRAVTLTERGDADVLDTYATVLFQQGKRAEAVEVGQEALDIVEDEALKAHIEQQLARFRDE